MLPFVVGGLAKSSVDPATLGMVGFLELGSGAITTIFVAPALIKRAEPLWLCVIGGLLIAAGSLGSATTVALIPALLTFRCLVGVGSGLMQAGWLSMVAKLRTPERLYGYAGAASCVTALAGFALAPRLILVSGNAGGVFLIQGVGAFASALLIYGVRRQVRGYISANSGVGEPLALGVAEQQGSATNLNLSAATWGVAVGTAFLLTLTDSTIWAFVAPLGATRGISLNGMGVVLMTAAVVGCFGPLMASRIGDRFGTLPPLVLGQFAMIALSLVMVFAKSSGIYAGALCARVFAILFLGPRYNGFYARIDPVGRLVAVANGFYAVGNAVGPLIGGQVVSVEHHNFVSLGFLSGGFASLGLLLTVFLASRPRGAASRDGGAAGPAAVV